MKYKVESKIFSEIEDLNQFLENIRENKIISITPSFRNPHFVGTYCLIYWKKVEEEIQYNQSKTPFNMTNVCNIFLNGEPTAIAKATLSYFDIVAYAKLPGIPTVAYRDKDGHSKILLPGNSIIVHSGMIINCVHTGNA